MVVFRRNFASYIVRKNYYEIIGVKPNASKEEIKNAFVEKTKELHPDRAKKSADTRIGWQKTSQTERFMLVKEAYDVLRNEEKRKIYDEANSTEGGFLMEAKAKTDQMSISKQNARRGEWSADIIPDARKRSTVGAHFRNPEEEYEKERKKNRMLVILGAMMAALVVSNILYVRKLHSDQLLKHKEGNRQ